MESGKVKTSVNLNDVPETLLWPLWNRACEQTRKDRLVEDPLSLELVLSIDYDFSGHFGEPQASHAVRARIADDCINNWLVRNPQGTVVSLGEGLDSQFWRVNNGNMSWFSVDLPEVVEMRHKLLPVDKRITAVPCSALDILWMDFVPAGVPVFIVASGLFMYFTGPEVRDLLQRIADRFPGGEIFFDMIPRWFSRKSLTGIRITKQYTAPPMPWGVNYGQYQEILDIHPSFMLKSVTSYGEPFPERMRPYSYLNYCMPLLKKVAPWMIHMAIY